MSIRRARSRLLDKVDPAADLQREPPAAPGHHADVWALLIKAAAQQQQPRLEVVLVLRQAERLVEAQLPVRELAAAVLFPRLQQGSYPDRSPGSLRAVPGDVAAALVEELERQRDVRRMKSRRPSSQMPPLGTVLADRAAVDLMTAWVGSKPDQWSATLARCASQGS